MRCGRAIVTDQCRAGCERSPAWMAVSLLCPLLCGCGHANELNLFGAYFPVWLLAILVGTAAAFACRYAFARFRIEPYVGPLTLIYVCITIGVSCLVWLLVH